MRAAALSLALLVLAAAMSGCGSREEETPAACLDGSGPYLTALEGAPGHVSLPGSAAISSCLTKNQPGGQLATVGQAMIGAATQLNARARAQDGGQAALADGFLVGAAARGASDTAGIHANLVQRLTAAALFSPGGKPLSHGFEAAYRSGYAAGKDHG